MQFSRTWVCLALLALMCSFTPNSALAQDGLDSGDTAWILISTGLVLFMMTPGLAMFYAGLVRSRNVLSIFIHCFGITALITVIWTLCGYSLAFTANNPFIGNFPSPSSWASPVKHLWGLSPNCCSLSSR